MIRFLEAAVRFVRNPWVGMFMGLLVMYAGLAEAWETLEADWADANAGASHGVALTGLVIAARQLVDGIEGMLQVHEAVHPGEA